MVFASLSEIKEQVKQKHQRFLEQQALVQELESLLQDASGCIDGASDERSADKKLKREGFRCSHKVYQAASDHLQAAKCAQHLQLPAASSASTTTTDAHTNGSLDHLLGVTPQQLIQLQVPDMAAAQKGCQALLPEVECRLQDKLQWLVSLFNFKGSPADLPQHAAAQLAAVGSGCQELLDGWQQQQHASRDHLQALQQALGTLTQLVEGHLLGQQQEADQVQQQWLEAHSQTLTAKLHVMEKQLLARTYTSDTVPALHKIDEQLTKAQRRLDARDQQVSAKLSRFEALGCEFEELAANYQDLQEDVYHAKFTLQEFQQAVQEEN